MDFASINVSAGAMRIQIDQAARGHTRSAIWQRHQVVLRPVAIFTPNDDSPFGLLCGNTDGIFFGAVITTGGALTFFKIDPHGGPGCPISRCSMALLTWVLTCR